MMLRNLNISSYNTATAGRNWTSSSAYGFYSVPYEIPLALDHYYYQRAKYKFDTTNQSPTWCSFYIQGGSKTSGGITNPVAGTEYIISGVGTPTIGAASFVVTSGTLYNGPSNAISGVTAHASEVLTYDVTELYKELRAVGAVTSLNTLKTWCDEKLEWVPRYTNYYIGDLIPSSPSSDESKIQFVSGTAIADNIVEAEGMAFYTNSHPTCDRNNLWFDKGTTSGIVVYNNSSPKTAVTMSIVSAEEVNSPFANKHPYCVQITTNGTASPYAGGFQVPHNAGANKIFVEKFVAKIPVGYTVYAYYNAQGTGNSIGFISSRKGTGDWAEYTVLYKCGSSGSFSTGGHIVIGGSSNTSVTWYLAYVNNAEITGNEYLKNYTVLPTKTAIKGGAIFVPQIVTNNLILNGNCMNRDPAFIPSHCSYDTEDKAGDAYASIVQPVGGGSVTLPIKINIDPTVRYKVSYWVKCKRDMSSFLTAIFQYPTSDVLLDHTNVVYLNGTKTTLSAALNPGDTSMTVANAASWAVETYSRIGFRSGPAYYMKSYNDKGTFPTSQVTAGYISGKDGNVVNFASAYNGAAMPAGTVVVESFDGGNYPYPILKSQLPTDNEWHYVEGYFGNSGSTYTWDGATSSGGWPGIPGDTRYIKLCLNIYTNNGTVPIKYSDIKIEAVRHATNCNLSNSIQFETHNIGD